RLARCASDGVCTGARIRLQAARRDDEGPDRPMTDANSTALLPPGMRDILPPDGAHAADIVERLRASFARWGYRWVKPPLIEYETSLLNGAGAAMSSETFRLMDPVSQRMMGLRADITLQVARIAATRLRNEPRPLRLSYYGDVL